MPKAHQEICECSAATVNPITLLSLYAVTRDETKANLRPPAPLKICPK